MAAKERNSTGIVVKNLTKAFRGQTVLDSVSLCAPAGSRVVLVGPSGAGKSTLLRIIAGLALPDAGEVYLGGRLASTPERSIEPRQRDVGFVFQNPTLWPHMTVTDNIMFGLAEQPQQAARQQVQALLAKARISHIAHKYPDQISGGEAKRAALIRSIAPGPRFLLVDEPFANLDGATKQALLEFLLTMVDECGMTLLYVTHDADEVRHVVGTVVALAGHNNLV